MFSSSWTFAHPWAKTQDRTAAHDEKHQRKRKSFKGAQRNGIRPQIVKDRGKSPPSQLVRSLEAAEHYLILVQQTSPAGRTWRGSFGDVLSSKNIILRSRLCKETKAGKVSNVRMEILGLAIISVNTRACDVTFSSQLLPMHFFRNVSLLHMFPISEGVSSAGQTLPLSSEAAVWSWNYRGQDAIYGGKQSKWSGGVYISVWLEGCKMQPRLLHHPINYSRCTMSCGTVCLTHMFRAILWSGKN